MKKVFFDKLQEAMRSDEKLFLLVGDTGFNLVEPIFKEFPTRALNVGVAEQNLIGISAGLCNAGFRPVCYAISQFLIFRCFEQIRNDICLHENPVVLVGTGTGFDRGTLGPTHHVVDDIGCLKVLPNIDIYSPSSKESVVRVFDEVMKNNLAAYIRIPASDFSEEGGAGAEVNRFVVKNGNSDILVITHGKMVKNAIDAAMENPVFSVFAMDRIKPLDEGVLKNLLASYEKVFVVEDNFKSGLYNSICQFAVQDGLRTVELRSISPVERYEKIIGNTQYFEDKYDLSPEKINRRVQEI